MSDVRTRLAKRILVEMRKDRSILSNKATAAADAVLAELGWDQAPTYIFAKGAAFSDGTTMLKVEAGTYRLVREDADDQT